MRSAPVLLTLWLTATMPALAQQLRNPADPAPRPPGALRHVEAPPRLPANVDTPRAEDVARERCLQQVARTIQPTATARVTGAQRRVAAIETQRAARGGDAADPTDRSGLRAQRDVQQRLATRERNAAQQRLDMAQRNCG